MTRAEKVAKRLEGVKLALHIRQVACPECMYLLPIAGWEIKTKEECLAGWNVVCGNCDTESFIQPYSLP